MCYSFYFPVQKLDSQINYCEVDGEALEKLKGKGVHRVTVLRMKSEWLLKFYFSVFVHVIL